VICPSGASLRFIGTLHQPRASATPALGRALHAYTQPNGDLHVNFIGVNDAHLHELLLSPPSNDLNLVGPGNKANTVFSSGAGTIIYAASTPLILQNSVPSCTGTTIHTLETSNSVYGNLDAGPSIVITRSFWIDPDEI